MRTWQENQEIFSFDKYLKNNGKTLIPMSFPYPYIAYVCKLFCIFK